ncbi:hypothetical protein ABHF91_14110 [Pseudaeromonas sp. ZJS20]|uniref:hypothetical protein n=1 Tax=Pseudaeromonas aegiceratis TaxID=3153928 RepID=UPI00390CAECB
MLQTLYRLVAARLAALLLCLMVSGCVAPLLVGAQSQLMWALLKPLVGLDPNQVNLFENSLIKDRMTALLGDENYDTALRLLKTADEIQQEGPLFFVLSRYSPLPEVAEQAGFVWNSETNQMAVTLISGGVPKVFAEQVLKDNLPVTPSWPAALQPVMAAAQDPQAQLQSAAAQALGSAVSGASGMVQQQTDTLVSGAASTLQQQASQAAEQAVSGANGMVQQQVQQAVGVVSGATGTGQ